MLIDDEVDSLSIIGDRPLVFGWIGMLLVVWSFSFFDSDVDKTKDEIFLNPPALKVHLS